MSMQDRNDEDFESFVNLKGLSVVNVVWYIHSIVVGYLDILTTTLM